MKLAEKEHFSNITIEKLLKTGDHGSVYLARDEETGKRCIYRVFQGSDTVYQKLRSIESENLPKIFGLETQDGSVFVLEEYIPGDTLAFLLEGGPLRETQAKSIALQVCRALTLLRQSGIVHRDIKPENIMVSGNRAVLIDFDAARLVKPLNRSDTQLMGTTGYAAPEQYGFSQTDARADIYSMGIVLNEMLTTRHPSTQLASGSFRPVIQQCTEMNMDMRYQSAQELYDAIVSRPGRKTLLLGLAVSLVAVLGLVMGLLLWQSSRPQQPVVFMPEPAELSGEQWTGAVTESMMPFTYDLDGDGSSEDYLFGIFQANIPEGFQFSTSDYFALDEGDTNMRCVYPCVWQRRGDGSLEMVTAFAPLLSDPEIQLWRASEEAVPLPEAYTSEDLWKGGLQIIFSLENQGTWIYEIHARLGNQTLNAIAHSTVDSMENYLKIQQ